MLLSSNDYCCSLFMYYSAEIEQKYKEIMKQTGILTLNGEVSTCSYVTDFFLAPPQKKNQGCSRKYPWGGHIFLQTPPPPGHTWSQSPPQPPGHVSPTCPTMDQIHLDPQDKLPPHSPPLGCIVNKTPSTHRTKKCLQPPQDNFWNSPYPITFDC